MFQKRHITSNYVTGLFIFVCLFFCLLFIEIRSRQVFSTRLLLSVTVTLERLTLLLLFLIRLSVCRLRERGRMSKSVYVRVVHDLELLRYVFVVRSNDSFNFPLG